MTEEKAALVIHPNDGAPVVYFDETPVFGVLNGAIQIELAAHILHPSGSGVESRLTATAHLRCSPAAALQLYDAIRKTLEMVSKQPAPAPSGAIN
ncbi:hypothetical protein [Aquamicrobium zhengzhouense]|uniref:DUF3467 domain-containing protein n=1 Tax=Aquamicrobium zhengzhouense TaxID=2781738 RepID=A0ABS0SAP7_9HYPH|nr:hypothetical protein [Aquamicrobium zhengzhouense]MBI1620369.1 hypothetical protein [Aquamicrobium zhengzhouense]